MWPNWVSNPGLLTYESGAVQTAVRDPAGFEGRVKSWYLKH